MIATALTLALLGISIAVLADLIRRDGGKMLAALEGCSWASGQAIPTRPVVVRFSPRYPSGPVMRTQPVLRAAA